MGGTAEIILTEATSDLLDTIEALLHRLDRLWTRFDPHSELSRLNASGGAAMAVQPETITLIQAMKAGVAQSRGSFDPTLLPTVLKLGYDRSWSDEARTSLLPDGARPGGDLDEIAVGLGTVALPRGMTLDAGGIGKGLAADLASEAAIAAGASGALVGVAGDVVVRGQPPDGNAWRIGIEDPANGSVEMEQVRLCEGSVATSSTRKRRWKGDAGWVHHLIDPQTGMPGSSEVWSATVIAATGAKAESLTKTCMFRPTDEAFEIVEVEGGAAMIVSGSGVRTSPSWNDYR